MRAAELRKKSASQLEKDIAVWREQVATLVRNHGVEEQKNVREIRALRKDIARALTVLGQMRREVPDVPVQPTLAAKSGGAA